MRDIQLIGRDGVYHLNVDLGPNGFISDLMLVSPSPFGNCQSFTIGRIGYLHYLEPEQVYHMFHLIWEQLGKNQLVIDVNRNKAEQILRILKPYIKDTICTEYTNYNGSPMTMIIIQFEGAIFKEAKEPNPVKQ